MIKPREDLGSRIFVPIIYCRLVLTFLRVALFYLTGAVVALSQAGALALASTLPNHPTSVSFILPIACEVLAFGTTALYSQGTTEDPFSELLLSDPVVSLRGCSQERSGYLAFLSSAKEMRSQFIDNILADKNLTLLASLIAVAGVSKATRSLFTTYIQWRYKFSSTEVRI